MTDARTPQRGAAHAEWRPRWGLAVVIVVLVLVAATGVYVLVRPDPEVYEAEMPAGGIFGPQSVWRVDVSDAPISAHSDALVANLVGQVTPNYGGIAALNVSAFNLSYYQVESGVPRKDVAFDDCQGKGYVPDQLYDPDMGAHFTSVPIPRGAKPALGTDEELSVYDPASDQLWEFWQAHRVAGQWHACWGGRMDDVSSGPGVFDWPMGVAATGLPYAGGMIRINEARRGSINHAMYLFLIEAMAEKFSYPANRTDGYLSPDTPGAIEEGQRFRLDPTLDVDSLGLTPIATMIAKAAQKYGFIVADTAGAVAVGTESSVGYQSQHGGQDPWQNLLDGVPEYAALQNFPWDRLQALPLDYGKP